MTEQQTRSVLAVCLLAAFADGHQDAREREHVRRVAESLSRESVVDVLSLYQDVLLGRLGLETAVAGLDTPALRQLAFEMAVGVCEADGAHSAPEQAFLERLGAVLGLERAATEVLVHDAEGLAQAALADVATPSPPARAVDRAELDGMILNAAILNGALELLPQSMASMAIIPLQLRLVYRIGKAHGYELDRGHVTDFLATVGVGMTGQYVEQLGRKLVGGLLGKVFGGVGRALGSQATGSAFSFATTYALGRVAERYYGEGRRLDAATLKEVFAEIFDQAKGLQARYRPEIEQRAKTLDLKQITAQLRG